MPLQRDAESLVVRFTVGPIGPQPSTTVKLSRRRLILTAVHCGTKEDVSRSLRDPQDVPYHTVIRDL